MQSPHHYRSSFSSSSSSSHLLLSAAAMGGSESESKSESESESCREVELVLIPWPVMGHMQIVELAKLIIHHQKLALHHIGTTISVTVLLMKLPADIDTVSGSFIDSLSAASAVPGLNFFQLPPTDPTPEWSSRTRGFFIHSLVLSQRSNVADFLRTRRPTILAVVTDMLCTSMIDVAAELGLPSYVFFTSPASFLGAMLHCQYLHDEQNQDVAAWGTSGADVSIPTFRNPVPVAVLPAVLLDKEQWLQRFLHYSRGLRKARGIIINTFLELETYALNSFTLAGAGKVPPVYPIGPIINRSFHNEGPSEALQWLDAQSSSSVVFLCFGSQGSITEDQIRELAIGIEASGAGFLWSLRRQSADSEAAAFPTEYGGGFEEVLPEGFLQRTEGRGRVVGWVPQMEVLSHPAVAGFVSHCGWNSVVESLWCGVAVAAWPLHAEQHMNAFQVVRELGLAVELTLTGHERGGEVVGRERIEKGIRELMDEGSSERKKRVKEMKEKSRRSVEEGGSSYISFQKLIQDFIAHHD
ncbi:anthocyanidin 3-O-glucosyltransferase 2-like [Andrographis paniculata]|uniref:anthocyanidin 3-O-glucosyltransferase 2-like n=1 Tax=Andrographis paniculata TaxID=175694 RepID=UPI0021E74523|nr:anthocyanidin 3-O-glucosyltransferase 2-like [Andrographis paniculata]